MHTGRNYSLREIVLWTRRETAMFALLMTVPTAFYACLGWTWLALPWTPVALLGTAVAFVTGFKNNAAYNRLWEARQAWGGLVNASRFWGTQVLDLLAAPTSSVEGELPVRRQQLIYRHLAYLTALRYQLRSARSWETIQQQHNVEYQTNYTVAEWDGALAETLKSLLTADDAHGLQGRVNQAAYLISRQSLDLAELIRIGALSEFQRVAMGQTLARLLDEQGRCERIKNFPYPRQFATLNLFFTRLFILLLPFALLTECAKLGSHGVWLTIPLGAALAWVLHTLDKIGESSENPFEGGPNDVPITAICRNIEIELRELLGETDLPSALSPTNSILM